MNMKLACIIISLTSLSSVLGQNNGEIRLIGLVETGIFPTSAGRLEIFLNGAWGTVCEEGFDLYDADVACQELGFLYADRVGSVDELGFVEGTGFIWLYNVECNISHTRLVNCSRASFVRCSHTQDTALRCSNTSDPVRLVSQTGRTTNLSAGRLEILINDKWGTVCDDFFNIDDAHVACHQMGYTEAVAYGRAGRLGYSANPDIPIWLDDLACSSSSSPNLRLCGHAGTGRENCAHSEDIISSCLTEGNLRLVRSRVGTRTMFTGGRLEIYLKREWGTVCSSIFSSTEAGVACRQLGYSNATNYGNSLGFPEAPSNTKIWLDNVQCNSLDMSLLSCSHDAIGLHSCDHSDDVELECGEISSRGGGNSSSPAGAVAGTLISILALLIFIGGSVFCVYCGEDCIKGTRRSFRHLRTPPYNTINDASTSENGASTNVTFSREPQQPPPLHPSNQNPAQPPFSNEIQEVPPINVVGVASAPISTAGATPPTNTHQETPPTSTLQEASPPSYEIAGHYPSPSFPPAYKVQPTPVTTEDLPGSKPPSLPNDPAYPAIGQATSLHTTPYHFDSSYQTPGQLVATGEQVEDSSDLSDGTRDTY